MSSKGEVDLDADQSQSLRREASQQLIDGTDEVTSNEVKVLVLSQLIVGAVLDSVDRLIDSGGANLNTQMIPCNPLLSLRQALDASALSTANVDMDRTRWIREPLRRINQTQIRGQVHTAQMSVTLGSEGKPHLKGFAILFGAEILLFRSRFLFLPSGSNGSSEI
jgi:hypothetical protein